MKTLLPGLFYLLTQEYSVNQMLIFKILDVVIEKMKQRDFNSILGLYGNCYLEIRDLV